MALLEPTSLIKTIDNINERFLYGETISQEDGLEAAQWIATQQGKKGSYRDLFAPTQADFMQGIRVFTGERLESASARHIMGQEAARAVWLLGSTNPIIKSVYESATSWMNEVPDFKQTGTFCCGKCTLAFWRHFWVGNFENKIASLHKGVQVLKNHRLGDGKWRRFPFFYAIYTLLDIDMEPVHAELEYARPAMERYVKNARTGVFSDRRIAIFIKALEKIS
jgi:hypothetical protein